MQSVMHHRNTFYTFFVVNLLQKMASKHFLGISQRGSTHNFCRSSHSYSCRLLYELAKRYHKSGR